MAKEHFDTLIVDLLCTRNVILLLNARSLLCEALLEQVFLRFTRLMLNHVEWHLILLEALLGAVKLVPGVLVALINAVVVGGFHDTSDALLEVVQLSSVKCFLHYFNNYKKP